MKITAVTAACVLFSVTGAFGAVLPQPLENSLKPAVIEALTTPADTIAAAAGDTENGLSEACKAVTIIFARGTNESGNVGVRAGPPMFTQLRATLGTAAVTVQGVEYSANVLGYLSGGDAAGSTRMATLITQTTTRCPSTKIVISGYSQGAQLVHNAARQITSAVAARIVAVVVFGDPFNGDAVQGVASSKVRSFCHSGDIICTGSGGSAQHLNYDLDAAAASSFVVARV